MITILLVMEVKAEWVNEIALATKSNIVLLENKT
jgi:hypothetical protein